jgi:oligoribonuclease
VSEEFENNQSPENLLWIDTETTGLDTRGKDYLLEVCLVATNKRLDVLSSLAIVLHHPADCMLDIAPIVVEMHTKNGLWTECASSKFDVEEVEQHLLRFCARFAVARMSPMCGSTVSFDREMLRTWMPTLESFFHYRNFDVWLLKIAAALRQIIVTGEPVFPGVAHRARFDVGVSIAEARAFLALL